MKLEAVKGLFRKGGSAGDGDTSSKPQPRNTFKFHLGIKPLYNPENSAIEYVSPIF